MDNGADSATVIDTRRFRAIVFDLDGVVTDTASVHAAAWTELFDSFLDGRRATAGQDRSPFTLDDYLRYVDGKPRYQGVADFLAARGIGLVRGEPTDPETAETVCGLGNRKDRLFRERLARDGVRVFESTAALIRRARALGIATGVFSASRNLGSILSAAGLTDMFDARIDGVDAERLGLAGKPDPATLLEVTRRLGSTPDRAVVVEDSEAGVTAGRDGGFGLVVGVDRGGHGERLRVCGADIVVDDLARIRVRGGFRRVSDVPDALAFWSRITDLLCGENPAVCLDFDGTLADIVPDPAAAEPVAGVGQVLAELAGRCPVAVISGRDVDDLRARVGGTGIWYAGSHGFELVAPDGARYHPDMPPGTERALAESADALERELAAVAGVRVERKRFAVAVHYRNVSPDAVGAVVAAVHGAGRSQGLRVTGGRKVAELRPDTDWDKGAALRWIVERLPGTVFPVYIGDDLTDEDAFDVVETDGLGVVVRSGESIARPTAAGFSLADPTRVRDFLSRLDRLVAAGSEAPVPPSWVVTFDGYVPAEEKLREALCTVGNGYFATRGAAPESVAGDLHYPGTYIAGLYNRLHDRVAGREIDNESLVNIPNWLPVTWRIADGDWFDIDTAELLSYRQQLDLRRAELVRRFRFRDRQGRITAVTQRRFAAMHRPHLGALQTTIVAENYSETVEVRATVDTAVANTLVARYRGLSSEHMTAVHGGQLSTDAVLVRARTNGAGLPLAMAVRTVVRTGGDFLAAGRRYLQYDGVFGYRFRFGLLAGQAVSVEKVVAVATGRDPAVGDPSAAAAGVLGEFAGYAELRAGHILAWDRIWARLRIDLDGATRPVQIVRLHLLHLIQTVSSNTVDLDVGVPARGLHGEAYRGHVFWDELFVFPVLNPRFPALTRALLRYRYRRLPQARRAAAQEGYTGAMFPWQSGSDGREESQRMHLNPLSGRWNPDPSERAHHIGSAVAYTVWQYYQATGDMDFLTECGAEMLAEIARFWAARAEFDSGRGRYSIRGVIGPDEFHSGYPRAPWDGIDNNAYTNIMAAWTILRALDAFEILPPLSRAELLDALSLRPGEMQRWHDIARRMYVPFHDGVISQFEGYEQLRELDWEHYRHRYGNIARLDRILESEGEDINCYRAGKQADVLMLFYLFSADELRALLGHLGYSLPPEMIPRTVDYYLTRTSHGSTLSALVHAWVLARSDRDRAVEYFDSVLKSDIADIQGGTTAEGIHLAAMAGSADLLQRCFTGLEMREEQLVFCPAWPQSLGTLSFPMVYRGHRLTVHVSGHGVKVGSHPGPAAPITVSCRDETVTLAAGETVRLSDTADEASRLPPRTSGAPQ